MSKPTNMFRKSLQKFDKQKIRTPSSESLKCYLCGQLLLGITFIDHSKLCSRGLKRTELPKLDSKNDSKLKKKIGNLSMATTQPIPHIGSARVGKDKESLNMTVKVDTPMKVDELMIVRKWIEKEEEKQLQAEAESDSDGEDNESEEKYSSGMLITQQNSQQPPTKIPPSLIQPSTSQSPQLKQPLIPERPEPTRSQSMSTHSFFEQVSGITVNCTNKQRIIQLILDTDFQASLEYSHLACSKEQLWEIEQVLYAMGGMEINKNYQRYLKLETDIIKTILNQHQQNPYQQLPTPKPLRPTTQQLPQQLLNTHFPQSQNFTRCVCGICSSDLTFGQKCRQLPCSHKYHKECIDPILPRCPRCE